MTDETAKTTDESWTAPTVNWRVSADPREWARAFHANHEARRAAGSFNAEDNLTDWFGNFFERGREAGQADAFKTVAPWVGEGMALAVVKAMSNHHNRDFQPSADQITRMGDGLRGMLAAGWRPTAGCVGVIGGDRKGQLNAFPIFGGLRNHGYNSVRGVIAELVGYDVVQDRIDAYRKIADEHAQ